jgi:hypothetical protein
MLIFGFACMGRGVWVVWHGGTVTQFVYLELAALLLVGGGGFIWESGKK